MLLLLLLTLKDRKSRVTEAEKVIAMVNDFSLPFCQLKLQILFNAEAKGEIQSDIVDVMFKAAVADSGATRSHWVNLVALMSQDAVRQVRNTAAVCDECTNSNRFENELKKSSFQSHS